MLKGRIEFFAEIVLNPLVATKEEQKMCLKHWIKLNPLTYNSFVRNTPTCNNHPAEKKKNSKRNILMFWFRTVSFRNLIPYYWKVKAEKHFKE